MYHRIAAARRAFNETDEDYAREMSQRAHRESTAMARGPPCVDTAVPKVDAGSALESGHNEFNLHQGNHLFLRGAVEGLILVLSVFSLADAAQWPDAFSRGLAFVLLVCWAATSAARESLDTLTYRAHYMHERRREEWELQNFPEGEVAEMVELYVNKGLPQTKARTVVEGMAESPNLFVDVMMLEELHMPPPTQLGSIGVAMRVLCATLLSGSCLEAAHYLLAPTARGSTWIFLCLISTVALGMLGVLRAGCTHQGQRLLALQTIMLAVPCTILSRFAGAQLAALGTVTIA